MTATQQLSLSYRPAYVGNEAWRALVEALRQAVAYLNPKEVAYELDIGVTYLDDALHERDRKSWRQRWTCVLLAMLDQRNDDIADEHARAILAAQAELTSFLVEERVERSAEDIVAALGRTEAGRAAIASVTGRRDRRR